jgi:hypothetical protein
MSENEHPRVAVAVLQRRRGPALENGAGPDQELSDDARGFLRSMQRRL